MAPSNSMSALIETLEEGGPRASFIQAQMIERFKDFRNIKEKRNGELHTNSDYSGVLDRIKRHVSRALEPDGPDPNGSAGVECVYLGRPYPPSTLRLAELKPLLLSELSLTSHHRGRVLLSRLKGIIDMTSKNTLVAIEDISGDVELLDLHFVCTNKDKARTWRKLGTWVAIKEPFFTLQEIFITECIRVDHHSDMIYAESWPSNLPMQFDLPSVLSESDKSERTPLEWKQAGNSALVAKDFDAAYASYTRGIRTLAESSGSSIEKDLHRNRAHVSIALGRYEGALTDALAALTYLLDDDHKRLDAKAYFRAARASYGLKRYETAMLFVCDQLELYPDDQDAVKLLTRIQDRVREQRHGRYDIEKIQKNLSHELRVDAADYIINTTIERSGPNRGRGLFATRYIQPGDLIMAETSFCSVWRREDSNLLALECNASDPDDALQRIQVGTD